MMMKNDGLDNVVSDDDDDDSAAIDDSEIDCVDE